MERTPRRACTRIHRTPSPHTTAFALAAAFALAGCSHGIQIGEHADDYNVSVETAENRMFLRNIIRAAKNRPMYFTRITSVNATYKSSVGLNPELRIGANSVSENFTNALSLSTSSTPNFALSVLQDKAFYNGILKPVDIDTFELFISQGWPQGILLNVFVEEARIERVASDKEGENQPLCVIRNNPDKYEEIRAFEAFVKFVDGSLSVGVNSGKSPFGPPLLANTISNAASLKNLKDVGVPLVENKDGTYQLKNSRNAKFFRVNAPVDKSLFERLKKEYPPLPKGLPPLPCPAEAVELIEQAGVKGATVFKETRNGVEGLYFKDQENKEKEVVVLSADLTLRSAESMIYYLGELTRVDIDPSVKQREKLNALPANRSWKVNSGLPVLANPGNAVSIRDGVQAYAISGEEASTMQYLTLVRQIFSLNTASKDVPTAQPPIRLITD